MKLGLIGQTGSGRATIFEALAKQAVEAHRQEALVGTIQVPDQRVVRLSEMYQPRKTIFAQVAYLLPGLPAGDQDKKAESAAMGAIRECDALINCVRNFTAYGAEPPTPLDDLITVEQEMILSDLVVVEKRLERVELERKRNRVTDPEEYDLLVRCQTLLEAESPLRSDPELANHRSIRGFAMLTAKPLLVLFNNADEDQAVPPGFDSAGATPWMVLRGKLEQELAQMSAEEAQEFMTEFEITALARERVIQKSYEILGLISFFTVGEDEVRAWTIPDQAPAPEAAGAIHTDFQKGFIRAEVVAYDDLMDAGTYAAARKQGTVRLEGKTYLVQNGDIINFRFNV